MIAVESLVGARKHVVAKMQKSIEAVALWIQSDRNFVINSNYFFIWERQIWRLHGVKVNK